MKKRMVRITGCLLAGALSIGSFGLNTYAAPVAGVSSVTAVEIAEGQTPAAGVSQALAQCLADSNDAAAQKAAEQAEQVSENDTPVVASEYTDIAIAQVYNYVNVRSEPNTDSEVLGKLYNNSAGTILETTDNGWYRIKSGNVDGYVKCEYVVPNDEELAKEAEKLNKITATQITVNFGNGTETVTRDMLKSWLVKGEDGTYTFDVNLVKPVVIGWSEKYNTYGKPRDFKTSGGGTVRLTTGDYGWRVWQDKTTDALIAALNAGQSGELEPTWLYKGQTHEGNDINGTYVEISIDQQRMWFYKNGTCLVDTPVVTGNPNKGHGTPKGGVWRLKDKASPFTLVGKKPDGSIDYEEPVNYWMPFNGGVGIHDLTKRSSFGGDIYLTNGSHGCINTPLDNVRTIYENIEVNTPIVVY